MPGLTTGIQIALNAVLTNSQAIEIIEHNVANANTAGYRRQSAVVAAAVPTPSYGVGLDGSRGAGQQGTGVLMDRIKRFTSDYLDTRYRTAAGESSDLETRQSMLVNLESLMAETSDYGLIAQLDKFWSGWQDLANDPTNTSLRTSLLDNASSLASAIQSREADMTQMRVDTNKTLENQVTEINEIASQIAKLNGQIAAVSAEDEQPNDLLDKRDLLLDRLAELTGATSTSQSNGEMIVNIGGHVLVSGQNYVELKAELDPSATNTDGLYRVIWEDGQQVNPTSGEMKGVMTVRDEYLVEQINGLDDLAAALITEVNTLHVQGTDLNGNAGAAFFTGTDARSIEVSSLITEETIAAAGVDSVSGESYDNWIADKIATLKTAKVSIGGSATQTMNDFYNSEVTRLATLTSRAKEDSGYKSLLFSSIEEQRESLTGVSLDEEAANLAMYQKGYQAAARLMNAYDELLDTIINGMGLVGR